MKNTLATILISLGVAASSHAAPILRLTTTTVGPVLVAQGSNGTVNSAQQPYAYNIGDGTLNLKVSSSASWLTATLGTSSNTCQGAIACTPVTVGLQTSSLAKGTYTGFVTVSDPNAQDSPQTISVTVDIGGNVPSQITLYAPPNGTASTSFVTGVGAGANPSTQSGGSWLSVAASGFGSFQFTQTFTVTANAANLAAGSYNGSIAISGSPFNGDNTTVPVALNVTTQPIAQPLFTPLQFTIAQNGVKQNYFTAYPFYPLLTNAGQGTLTVSGATAATSSGGSWLTLASDPNNNGFYQVTADATGVSPGTYNGTITINTNAVNSPTVIPVQLTVLAAGPPSVRTGVANPFTGSPDDGISQGDWVIVYGSQFIAGNPQFSPLPFPTTLAGTQVLINGQPVPIDYVSPGQINAQVPYNATVGQGTLQVVTNGTKGNTVTINITQAAPALLQVGSYVYAQTASGAGFEGNSPSNPAHIGDTVVLYAVGLGVTSPAVTEGTAAPSSPGLAMVTPTPTVCFGGLNPIFPTALCTTPQFAGLTPGFAGLYQLNITIPNNAPTGDAVPIFVQVGNSVSNIPYIAIH